MQLFRATADVRAQAAELLPLVIAARIELEAAVAQSSDAALANHNLVASVRASLERLRGELDDLSEAPGADQATEHRAQSSSASPSR